MSKINTILKLMPKVFGNLPAILEGIKNDVKLNHGLLPEDMQEEIIARRLICKACPLNSDNAHKSDEYFALYNEHYVVPSGRNDLHCALCECNIDFKTANLDVNCGIEYYNDTHKNNKQELKWTKYEKPINNNNEQPK